MAYIALEDLEYRVGASNIARYLDDDGDGTADENVVEAILAEASGYADSLLLGAFSTATIEAVKADARFIGAVADIALGLAAERKPEWQRSDGKFPYAERMMRGREALEAIGKGAERLGLEETTAKNPRKFGASHVPLPVEHYFAPSRTNPKGSGGF